MAVLAFGEYRADVSDLNTPYTQRLRNVLPQDDGYRPHKALTAFTQALPAQCRGYFVARRTDGQVAIFAGTATKLYLLDNTTLVWTDVSKGAGTYSQIAADANWCFAQFNNIIIATQKNDVMQAYDLSSSALFADLAGSPPQAGWIAVISRFIVAGDLLSNQFRIHWSALNSTTGWTAGTNLSDVQDLPFGGRVRCIAKVAGDVGLVLQEGAVRRMIFAPGSNTVFQIDVLKDDLGTFAPWSLTTAGGMAFFYSTRGFVQMDASGGLAQIGEEKVDRTFLADYDSGYSNLLIGASDPTNNLVLWTRKSLAGAANLFDKVLAYHWTRKRWAPLEFSGEFIAPISRPGITLEGLSAIAPGALTITGAANNGAGLIRITVASTATLATGDHKTISGVVGTTEANGSWTITVINATTFDLQGSTFANAYVSGGIVGGSIDAMTTSLDELGAASLPALAAMDSTHKLALFSGDTLEATLETPEQSLPNRRMGINGLRPITDAPSAFCFVRKRDSMNDAYTDGSESALDDDGNCPLLEETRYARGILRVPAATAWTFARGLEPDAFDAGRL